MKNSTMTILLAFVLFCLQSFSQKSKPYIKSDPVKIQAVNKDLEPKSYCTSTYTNQTDDSITHVKFNSISNYSGQDGPNSYGDYTFSHITGVVIGGTYPLSVTFNSGIYTQHVRAWFDWNDDDIFSASESYYLGSGSGVSVIKTLNITVPVGADLGDTRFRIIEQYGSDPGADGACDGMGNHTSTYGETEDYTVVIYSNSYCQASGGCDEFIWIVEFPDHGYSYSSGCTGYVDFSPYWLIPVPLNTSANITIVNGNPIYPQDQCGVWVDWNRDDDFYDANEQITVNGSPGVGPYFATLVPPPGATLGECIVRIRIQYSSSAMDPCGIMPYGEVEDYRINLLPEVPCTWTGAVDNIWHNPDNWNTINIPGATDDVIIPNVTNKCWVDTYGLNAECKNLTVEAGTLDDLKISNESLIVNGNMDVYGMVTIDSPLGDMVVTGNINWHSGSTLYVPEAIYTFIVVHGDWITQAGSNIYFNDGLLSFGGTGGSYLRTFSNNCNYYDLAAYKTGGTQWVSISSNSAYDLNINGRLIVMDNDILYVYSPHDINLKGDLDILGHLYCYDGDFIFDGDVQEIDEHLSYSTTCEFNNLTLNSTTSTTVVNKDITISNDLTIQSGQFIPNDHTISVGWYWNNQISPSAFVEGNSRVIFTGASCYIWGNENFHILELDMPSTFSLLNIDGYTVSCEYYDWSQGSISVREGGEFTANDLIDNGIYGGWGVDNTGGTINISNYGEWVDLNGYISLTGGTMNVYGGTTPSYWPLAADATIHMTDGVLDFHDQGIYITDFTGYSLTENISGGTIRTAGGFWGESSDFSPDYGTMEFYGSTDGSIYTINNCHLNDVIINKSTKNSSSTKSQIISLVDERSGKSVGNGTKSNMLTQTELIYIHGSLVINNGILNSNGYDILIEADWTNNAGDAGFIESTGVVGFVGYNKVSVIHTDEIFYNLLCSNASSGIFGLTLMDGIIIQVNNDLDIYNSALEMNYGSELHIGDDVYIALGGGLNADDGANILSVGGNWTNENVSNTQYYGYRKGGEIVTFHGSGDQIITTDAPEETFGNIIINKSSGYFRPNDDIHIHGGLIIQDGDWWDNIAGLDHWLTGNILIEANGGYFPEGTTTFKGLNTQTYQNNGGSAVFGDVVVDKHYTKMSTDVSELEKDLSKTKAGGTLILNSNMVVFNDHNTTIVEGKLDLNGNAFKSTGWLDILDGGILYVDGGAELILGSTLWVFNGGEFITIGESGNNAHIRNDATGQYYSIDVYGGTISANYTIFDDLAPIGIEVWDGANIDPSNSFNNCSFDGYTLPGGSTWLKIENQQTFTIDNISFPNHPGGSLAHNIGKESNWGHISVTSTSGAFTGPLYENDPHERIDWTDFPHGRWTGNVSSDWFDPMNWGDFVVPTAASDVVIPAGRPNYPIVNNSIGQCSNLTLEAGASLEIGNSEIHVGDIFDNFGHLVMTNSMAKLYIFNTLYWQSVSTANITTGEIHGFAWIWGDANISLGIGNTVFLDYTIGQYGPYGSFGNLVLSSGNNAQGSDPIHVSGNLTLAMNASWDTYADWIIDGGCIIEHDATLDVLNGAHFECNSSLTFIGDSELFLYNNSMTTVHGMFNFNSGFMVIENSSFICDFSLPSGWINIQGGIDMVSGSLEFPDANISFVDGQYFSGGTIVAGRSVHADIAGIFQPTGGTLELVGSSTGHYLQIKNGNYIHNLLVNRSAPIGIHPGSPLIVMGSVNLNSELMLQGNTMVVMGDLDINGGGTLNMNDNSLLAMDDNSWLAVNTGGTLEAIGSSGNEVYITHNTGYYHFWTGNGSTIRAEHAVFEYMAPEGILLNPGAFVDPAYSFDNCTFRNGYAGGRLLTINSDQNFTVTDAVFPANTWSGTYNVYKDVDEGSVNFIDATGAFSGESFEYDPHNRIHWGITVRTFELDVFLEGPFNPVANEMTTGLNTILSTTQPYYPVLPYFGNPMPDWYYGGSESVGSIPSPYIIDWIVVQLREGTSPGTAINILATQAAFLTDDGHVVGLDGVSPLSFSITYTNNLYALIWHRNHLGVISANPLVDVGGLYSYDFSSGSGQAYGGTSAQKQIGTKWVMMSGDGNGDGQVSYPDISDVWNLQAGNAAYLESDYNMNGQVGNKDKNDNWLPNSGAGSFIPE